jgi:hypothetical protein
MNVCSSCGTNGKLISPFTVCVMVRDQKLYLHPESLTSDKYFMCESFSCPIVYFDGNGGSFKKSDLRIKVWQKENDPNVPTCYCFHHSVSSIRKEIEQFGKTTVMSSISAEVKAGNCRCEVTNPQGSCCLGNVAKAIKLAQKSISVSN